MNFRLAGLCLGTKSRNTAAIFALLISSTLVSADTKQAILDRMNAAAPSFHGATADVKMDTYESILDSHTIEQGTLQMQRSAKEVRAILAFTGKDSARTLAFQAKKLLIYYPNTNFYQEYDLGSKSQLLNEYLLLGFGSSGNDLAKNYDITDGGSATVEGQSTTMLILVPKSPDTKEKLSKVEIWIPGDGANPVQQQFFQPNGDYRKVTYTNLKVNPPLAGPLVFKLPAGATKK